MNDFLPSPMFGPGQMAAQHQAQLQWMQQQAVQQKWAAEQQRLADERAWLASTKNVGLVIALGLYAMAFLRVVMFPLMWGGGGLADTLLHAPLLAAGLGGALTAVGWWIVLASQPRGGRRFVAFAGMLGGVGLAALGIGGLVSANMFAAVTSHSLMWTEVGVTALVLIGSSLWRDGTMPVTGIIAWVGFALMLLVAVANGDTGGGAAISYCVVPAATWALAGTAILGVRADRPELAGGMPSAILVPR